MNTEERNELVFKGKLCGRCLYRDVVIARRNEFYKHRRRCEGPGTDYVCGEERCKFHIWFCKLHAARNTEKMKSHSKDMLGKGITMGLMNIQMVNTVNTNTITKLKTVDQAIRHSDS